MFFKDPEEYIYYKNNPYFAKSFVNIFIERIIESQIIPDILIEVINELENERQEEKLKLMSENYIKQKYMYPKLSYLVREKYSLQFFFE